jgi:hypothetical protein
MFECFYYTSCLVVLKINLEFKKSYKKHGTTLNHFFATPFQFSMFNLAAPSTPTNTPDLFISSSQAFLHYHHKRIKHPYHSATHRVHEPARVGSSGSGSGKWHSTMQ